MSKPTYNQIEEARQECLRLINQNIMPEYEAILSCIYMQLASDRRRLGYEAFVSFMELHKDYTDVDGAYESLRLSNKYG